MIIDNYNYNFYCKSLIFFILIFTLIQQNSGRNENVDSFVFINNFWIIGKRVYANINNIVLIKNSVKNNKKLINKCSEQVINIVKKDINLNIYEKIDCKTSTQKNVGISVCRQYGFK